MEMVKGKALAESMAGSFYKYMLLDDLAEGKEWLEELMAARKGTAEFDCYYTFVAYGIFRMAQDDAYERFQARLISLSRTFERPRQSGKRLTPKGKR